jgi:type IV pilus assembly protein PilP
MMLRGFFSLLPQFALCAALLTACGNSSDQDLRAFIETERATQRPVAKPLPAPKPFEAVTYDEGDKRDPFNRVSFAQSLLVLARSAKPTLATPELARTKEPLEGFALDAMTLVGVLSKSDRAVALVRVDGKLHQLHVGNHLGQHFGKITKVEETQITLREIVQDELGDWVARQTTLKLQEKSK